MKVLSAAAVAVLAAAAPLYAQGAPPAPPAAASPAPALSNTIKWSTASEVENFGYDVFRGDAEEGPFTKINAKTIAGAGTVDEPSAYQYVDAAIEPGKAYWYYVESISMAGVREKFTPVFRSKAKNADGTPAAEPEKPKS